MYWIKTRVSFPNFMYKYHYLNIQRCGLKRNFSDNIASNIRFTMKKLHNTSGITCQAIKRSIKNPYKAMFVFLVGRARCNAAIDNCTDFMIWLTKMCGRQWNVHTSQKIHQALHLYSCYCRMFGEEVTKKMLNRFRKLLVVSGRSVLLSATCMTPFNWKKNGISDEKLEKSIEEFDSVDRLLSSTVYCPDCRKRHVLDRKMPDVEYCACAGAVNYVDKSRTCDGWEAFLECDKMLVWRRKHHEHTSLYSYKVYGSYDDLSVSAFMEVQLNPSYRRRWDESVLQLRVIESCAETDSDLLYWLVKYPHFFADRDYVFARRFRVNRDRTEVVIVNEAVSHPGAPEAAGVHRVREYWSVMVLRASEDFSKPGMSYTLTYFDNPGTTLPAPITNFVASSAFPNFLTKVHGAALQLQSRWESGEDVYVSLPRNLRYSQSMLEDLRNRGDDSAGFSPETAETTVVALPDRGEGISDEESAKEGSRFKPTLVELMEAIEVTSPPFEQKTRLTRKIELIVERLGLDKRRKGLLIERLETIRNRTKAFIQDAEKKKQESLKIMNEVEKKRNYYEQSAAEDPTVLQFTALLNAVNEIMLEDKDMRTGKLFCREETRVNTNTKNHRDTLEDTRNDCNSLTLKSPPNDFEFPKDQSNNTSISRNSQVNYRPNVPSNPKYGDSCDCCACDLNSPQSWFDYLFFTNLWKSDKRSKDEYCRTCSCVHKPYNPNSTIDGHSKHTDNNRTLKKEASPDSYNSSRFTTRCDAQSQNSSLSDVSSKSNSIEDKNILDSTNSPPLNQIKNDKSQVTSSYSPWYWKLWQFVF